MQLVTRRGRSLQPRPAAQNWLHSCAPAVAAYMCFIMQVLYYEILIEIFNFTLFINSNHTCSLAMIIQSQLCMCLVVCTSVALLFTFACEYEFNLIEVASALPSSLKTTRLGYLALLV